MILAVLITRESYIFCHVFQKKCIQHDSFSLVFYRSINQLFTVNSVVSGKITPLNMALLHLFDKVVSDNNQFTCIFTNFSKAFDYS